LEIGNQSFKNCEYLNKIIHRVHDAAEDLHNDIAILMLRLNNKKEIPLEFCINLDGLDSIVNYEHSTVHAFGQDCN